MSIIKYTREKKESFEKSRYDHEQTKQLKENLDNQSIILEGKKARAELKSLIKVKEAKKVIEKLRKEKSNLKERSGFLGGVAKTFNFIGNLEPTFESKKRPGQLRESKRPKQLKSSSSIFSDNSIFAPPIRSKNKRK